MAKTTEKGKKSEVEGEVLFRVPLTLGKNQIVVDPKGVETEMGLFRDDETSREHNFEIYIILAGERYVIGREETEDEAKAAYEDLIEGLAKGKKRLTLIMGAGRLNISAKDS